MEKTICMLSKSKAQTQKLAAKLAKTLINERSPVPHGGIRAKKIISEGTQRHAKVLALIGDLGAGKTAFAQGFIKSFGVKTHVPSPTFVIFRRYPIHQEAGGFKNIFHFDLYRIQKPKEIMELGFKEILNPPTGGPENIVLIEWPEKILKLLPKNTIKIFLSHSKKEKERIIKIEL